MSAHNKIAKPTFNTRYTFIFQFLIFTEIYSIDRYKIVQHTPIGRSIDYMLLINCYFFGAGFTLRKTNCMKIISTRPGP